MPERGPISNYYDLAFAILEQAVDDSHSTSPKLKADAQAFLADPYPRDLYLTWLDIDVREVVRAIIKV